MNSYSRPNHARSHGKRDETSVPPLLSQQGRLLRLQRSQRGRSPEEIRIQRIRPEARSFLGAGFAEVDFVRCILLGQGVVVRAWEAVGMFFDHAILHPANLAESIGGRLAVHDHSQAWKAGVFAGLVNPRLVVRDDFLLVLLGPIILALVGEDRAQSRDRTILRQRVFQLNKWHADGRIDERVLERFASSRLGPMFQTRAAKGRVQ